MVSLFLLGCSVSDVIKGDEVWAGGGEGAGAGVGVNPSGIGDGKMDKGVFFLPPPFHPAPFLGR